VREKLNNDPKMQVALVAVLVVVALLFFLKSSGGGEEEEAESGGAAVTETTTAGMDTGAVEAGTGSVPTSIPAPPPPAEFTSAYDSGKTVVLLVSHDGGIDDRLTGKAADAVEGMPEAELIRVPLKQLPRYAAVTVGLDLNRMPALVVVKPRRLSHGVVQATVDYGFQTHQSVVQAVRDASYKGPEATYYPD